MDGGVHGDNESNTLLHVEEPSSPSSRKHAPPQAWSILYWIGGSKWARGLGTFVGGVRQQHEQPSLLVHFRTALPYIVEGKSSGSVRLIPISLPFSPPPIPFSLPRPKRVSAVLRDDPFVGIDHRHKNQTTSSITYTYIRRIALTLFYPAFPPRLLHNTPSLHSTRLRNGFRIPSVPDGTVPPAQSVRGYTADMAGR